VKRLKNQRGGWVLVNLESFTTEALKMRRTQTGLRSAVHNEGVGIEFRDCIQSVPCRGKRGQGWHSAILAAKSEGEGKYEPRDPALQLLLGRKKEGLKGVLAMGPS